MALFEPARHEPLTDAPWDAGVARGAIAGIVADTLAAWRGPQALWPIHPIDVSPERPDPMKALYYGAAGVIFALQQLQARGAVGAIPAFGNAIGLLPAGMRVDAETLTGRANPGFLLGEAGALMLQFRSAPGEPLARRIHAALASHRDDPTEGLTWGAPGAMLAALHMHALTQEPRWVDLYRGIADAVWDRMRFNHAAGCWLWRQDLYGDQANQLGALHGFAGVAYAFLRGLPHLAPSRRADILDRVTDTVARTALREDGLVNWPFEAGGSAHPGSDALRVQHCMGAPGFVNLLAGLPDDAETNRVLLGAGELTWRAGPLAKHPCLCHGTPGNGFALLKLFARTGDDLWLGRARRFAMHAIAQAEPFTAEHGQRKFSLWTGDLGLALYLQACLEADPAFPTLDTF